MKALILSATFFIASLCLQAQGPIVTSWLQNTTTTGTYYVQGNSVAISNGELVNCQQVEYSTNWVFVTTAGIPAYPTGPFLDGNPSQATNQNAIYRLPLTPTPASTPTSTTAGNIGVFINGVSLFDYRDGVAWNPTTNALCGGPGNPPCPSGTVQAWNRDAIPAEMDGFDCSKAHPAMGNYHHHQNPSAFKLDLNVVSSICDTYDADALYSIDASQHSPLIGFAYDGYPIYGAYGYKNSDGTGGVVRMESGYQLRNITQRLEWADGTDVDDGPPVSGAYFLGYFREDYEWIAHPNDEEFLDVHNGRFSVTPEYPNGIYCYYATVDANWNSSYPYVVGPTFYGDVVGGTVNNINPQTTIYTGTNGLSEAAFNALDFSVYPNPSNEMILIQVNGLLQEDIDLALYDAQGRLVKEDHLIAGSTISYFDTQALYAGSYVLRLSNGVHTAVRTLNIVR